MRAFATFALVSAHSPPSRRMLENFDAFNRRSLHALDVCCRGVSQDGRYHRRREHD